VVREEAGFLTTCITTGDFRLSLTGRTVSEMVFCVIFKKPCLPHDAHFMHTLYCLTDSHGVLVYREMIRIRAGYQALRCICSGRTPCSSRHIQPPGINDPLLLAAIQFHMDRENCPKKPNSVLHRRIEPMAGLHLSDINC